MIIRRYVISYKGFVGRLNEASSRELLFLLRTWRLAVIPLHMYIFHTHHMQKVHAIYIHPKHIHIYVHVFICNTRNSSCVNLLPHEELTHVQNVAATITLDFAGKAKMPYLLL